MKLNMNGVTKERFLRYDRESICVYPSKLSKKELEDLYFSLLDTNVELKKTINNDQDRIKVLSARLQRMTISQRHSIPQRGRDCCSRAQTVIDGQNDKIQDLERQNMHLTEKVKMLNLKLSSAKQFLRRSSSVSGRVLGRDTTRKSSSATLNTRKTDLVIPKSEAACQCSEVDLNISNDTNITSHSNSKKIDVVAVKMCEENKCQCQVEEYKQRIAHLQEELSTIHSDYDSKVAHLQHQLSELQAEYGRALGGRTAAEQTLADRNQRLLRAKDEARQVQAKCADLTAELSIERKKLAEMETQLKSLDRSQSISRTIEVQLSRIQSPSVSTPKKMMTLKLDTPSPVFPLHTSTPPAQCLNKSDELFTSHDKQAPASDDSGYNDPNKSGVSDVYKSPTIAVKEDGSGANPTSVLNSDEKLIVRINKELMMKITELQKQLNALKIPVNNDEQSVGDVAYNKGTGGAKSYTEILNNQDETEDTLKEDGHDRLDKYEDESNYDDYQDPKIQNHVTNVLQKSKDAFSSHIPGPIGSVAKKTNKRNKKVKTAGHNKSIANQTHDKSNIENTDKSKAIVTKRSSEEKKSSFECNDSSLKSNIVENLEESDSSHILKEENIKALENKRNEEEKGVKAKGTINQSPTTNKKDIKSTNDIEKQEDKEKPFKQTSSETFFIRMDSSEKLKTDTQEVKAVIHLNNETEINYKDKIESKISEERNREQNANTELRKSNELGIQMSKVPKERAKRELSHSQHTYTLKGPVNIKSSDTDVDTERDVSSMTDLPTERESSFVSAPSPGEQRYYYRHESDTSPMSYDGTELSEGEIGAYRGKNLSAGEKPIECYNIDCGNQVMLTSAERLEATLQAVSAELKRCTRLLLMKHRRGVKTSEV